MRADKLWAKLTAGGQDPESMAMPPGGQAVATNEDAAGAPAFARLEYLAYELGRGKYALDEAAKRRVKEQLRELVHDKLIQWQKTPTSELARELAALLYEEYLEMPRCQRCKGAGSRWIRKVWRECPTCRGEGEKRLSNREKARRTGISETTWRRVWMKRYSILAGVLTSADRQALGIGHQLEESTT